MTSIRWTALAWIAAVLTAVGLVGVLVAYFTGRDEANFFFDGQLAQVAMQVGDGRQTLPPKFLQHDPEDELVVQIWDVQDGKIRTTGGVDIPRQGTNGFVDLTVDGVAWRVFTTRAGGRTVQVSHRQEVRDDVAEQLAMSAALPILAAIPIAWVIIVLAMGRLFKRLDHASIGLARRSINSTEPLPLDVAPVEVRPLIEAMNELLRRQRTAIEQQRQFVSDAAHELRTPLTAIQILADTLRERSPRPGEQGSDITGELALAVQRARSLSNQLLKLAEIDAGSKRDSSEVDLHSLLLEVIETHVQYASQKRIDFSLHVTASPRVKASKLDLSSLFSNLIDNAVRYSMPDSVIEISVRSQDGSELVEVIDSGSGIAAEALPRIFDRFFRAASPEIEGTGLGLSIAKAIADRYGLALSIANRPSGGVIARVTIPRGALLTPPLNTCAGRR
ncbi:MAG: two-component system, OmpR family, sensor kinase [Rhodospirillaceae bacterium]|nr:two-component system, OmpR family, sensor kinase [Rhodospirillaceae bacterium]